MATMDEKIAAAEQRAAEAAKRLRQLKAARELEEARKLQRVMKGGRSEDTRRKILVGAFVLDLMEREESYRAKMLERLSTYLTRDDDRALFDLPPRQQGQS